MSSTPRILLVDDDAFVRQALSLIVRKSFPEAEVKNADSLENATQELRNATCDIITLDLGFGKKNGIALIKELRALNNNTPILVLSSQNEETAGVSVIEAGANGYLSKDLAVQEKQLATAITTILEGRSYMSESLCKALISSATGADANRGKTLSEQESKVLLFIATGNAPKEIAARMEISEKTVRTYRSRLLEKLSLHSDTEIVRYAYQTGLID